MAASMRFLWFLILSLCCLFYCSDAGHAKKKALPSVIVVGTVFCDTRFHKGISKSGYFIAGAAIAVECWDSSTKPSFRGEVQTNRHGKFEIHLPAKTNPVGSCSVKLIRSSERFSSVAASSRTSINKLRLKSVMGGVHVFSAGLFAFTPLNQNPDFQDSNSPGRNPNQRDIFFLPSPPLPIVPSPPNVGGVPLPANPVMPQPPLLPPLPTQPAPPNTGGVPLPLPPNPSLPQPPNTGGVPLPPNPLQPQPPNTGGVPLPLPPNPSLPQPPNTGGIPLPPNPIPQPPLPSPPPLPPIPIITPPPAPPPTTLPPSPLFPGIPPASSSKGVSP